MSILSLQNVTYQYEGKQGKCAIIVTHSDKVAARCDFVHRLEKGRLNFADGH